MDIVVRKKQQNKPYEKQSAQGRPVQVRAQRVSCVTEEDEGTYCVYQLGVPYRRKEGYLQCYHGANDPREQFDVRAYLYEDKVNSAVGEDKCSDEQQVMSYDTEDVLCENEMFFDIYQDAHVDITQDHMEVVQAYNDPMCIVQEQAQKDVHDDSILSYNDGAFCEEVIAEKTGSGGFSLRDVPIFQHDSMILFHHISRKYAMVLGVAIAVIASCVFVGTSFAVKGKVDDAGRKAIVSLKSAMGSIAQRDFDASQQEFDGAYQEFVVASEEMGRINWLAKYFSQFIPGASALSSGNHMVEAGKYLTHSAKELHGIIPTVIGQNDRLVSADGKHVSFLVLYQMIADRMDGVRYDLASAQSHIDQVRLDDVPEEYRSTFADIKDLLPEINTSLRFATESRPIIEDMLGANGPRTFLLLFQNNHEMRATGGFIGSYGIVKIKNGQIEKIMVDDVYNPDGQLIDRIVPPLPIQKISANWSLHDSNWFADYPVSAKKAMDFYERTGGPTVDGVIAITPEMMEKFLRVTGPIDLPEQHMQITDKNFMESVRDEVEERNKERLNPETKEEKPGDKEGEKEAEKTESPKKVLSDIMPIMIDRLFDVKDPSRLSAVASAVSAGLKERHILLYMSQEDAQKIIEQNGWSGSIMQTDKDYLSVVNSNINGFKTDGVITETISHTATINDEGDVIDTVQIKRVHEGGHTGYPWWDAVNADYMRVYVPEGAVLLSAEGHTREINAQRLSYDALGYERDQDVEREEKGMHIDEETGTRIYNEFGKTVFANWVYVSPQESVTVTYTYKLPFKVSFDSDAEGKFGSYAVLFQKQSGSERSSIKSAIELPKDFSQVWHAHDDSTLRMENDLTTDRYNGTVFRVQ